MNIHTEARTAAAASIQRVFGREALGGEAAGEAGVSWLETNYDKGWKGAGKGSRNKGAQQCGPNWKGRRFSYFDTHPNADGTNTKYQIDFRAYDSEEDSWDDMCRTVYVNRGRVVVRAAAVDRDWFAMSKGLHSTGYYEGYGKTVAERINNHYRSLSRAIALADGAAKLPLVPIVRLPETVSRNTRGVNEAVKLLQRELQLAADGLFGNHTDRVLRLYQASHGLVDDGVCGPKTWEALFHDEYVPGAA